MNGYVGADEHHRRRVERIALGKLELERILFAVVKGASGASEINDPDGDVALERAPVNAHAGHGILNEIVELFLQSLLFKRRRN